MPIHVCSTGKYSREGADWPPPTRRPLCGWLACTGRAKLHTQSPTETVPYFHYTPTDQVHISSTTTYGLVTAIHCNPLQCIVSTWMCWTHVLVWWWGRVAAIEGEEQIEHGC